MSHQSVWNIYAKEEPNQQRLEEEKWKNGSV